jgi:hypothetical protein
MSMPERLSVYKTSQGDAQLPSLLKRLSNINANLVPYLKTVNRNTPLWRAVYDLGQAIREYSTARVAYDIDVNELVSMANILDNEEKHAMADVLDEAILRIKKEAASPYTHFYHFYYLVNSLFKSFQTAVMGQEGISQDWLDSFGKDWQKLMMRYSRFVENPKYKYSREASMDQKLVRLAQIFDDRGDYLTADVMDRASSIVRENAQEPPVKPGNEISLQTRYCPDHDGVQAFRISEREYQCPLDGKKYNYEAGYEDYSGQRVPGGNISAQTPDTMPYALPNRLFDSRQTVINTMN